MTTSAGAPQSVISNGGEESTEGDSELIARAVMQAMRHGERSTRRTATRRAACRVHSSAGMAEPVLSSRTHSVLYTYMMHSHDCLRDLFVRLLAAMEVDATSDVCRLWTELDRGLTSHMDAEERHVLPAFAKVDRAEALALVREHGYIRELLFELGVAIDLHCLRYERSQEFIHLLLAHAGREEQLLYRWADQQLPDAVVEEVRQEIAAMPRGA
jgi:hypothetical protein